MYPIGKSMEIPTWATLILAACLICGESMLDAHRTHLPESNTIEESSSSKFDGTPSFNYNRNVDYGKDNSDDERTTSNVPSSDHYSAYSSNRQETPSVNISPKVVDRESGGDFDQSINSINDINNNDKDSDIIEVVDNQTFEPKTIEPEYYDEGANHIEEKFMSNLKAGRTINLFPRYGSLTLTIKVMPSPHSNSWLFREKTSEILMPGSYWERSEKGMKLDGGFDEHYLIDFCDTPNDLYAAYFDHFEIEGIPEGHKAFTSFLSLKKKARFMGLHDVYLRGDKFSYVLVRLFKTDVTSRLDGTLHLSSEFQNATDRIRVGSTESAHQFMDVFGTHVITEHSVGDVIYQVFVFGPESYNELKNHFALSYQELKGNFTEDSKSKKLLEIRDYFTPYLAVNVGEVLMASGDPKFQEISEKLRKRYFFLRFYQSIFQILNDKEIEKEVVNVEGRVITGMKMRKITRAMMPSPKRYWLSLILDNCLTLFYTTM